MSSRVIVVSTLGPQGIPGEPGADGPDAASGISVVPSGNLSSTNAQAALQELQADVDSRALASDLTAHLSDSADAHAASAITNTPSGNLAATTVQGALNELQTDLDGRQPSDSDLTALAGLSSTGLISRTGSGTASVRTITGTANRISVTNGDGVSGNPTLDVGSDLVTLTDAQTLTNKTLTAPTISSPTGLVKGDVGLGNVDNTSDATKNAAVATLTNKTLTTPVIDVASLTDQGSTPSTPSSGTTRFYSKTDGKLYYITSAGVETQVGAGSGGGSKNYVSSNPDAEASAGTWTTYADAAGALPVDMTGGSPTVTWTRTTSTPLRGVASFLFTKDANNRQGEGVAFPFTLDNADLAKVITITADYEVASGTFVTGDLAWYAVGDTGGTPTVIQPSGYQVQALSSTKGRIVATFQTLAIGTGYRVGLHTASTSASAYTVKFDNIQVGPTQAVYGVPVTDWVSYTPTVGGFTTNRTSAGKWRRVGDTMEIEARIIFSGAPSGSEPTIALPSGHSIDVNKLSTTTPDNSVGHQIGFGTLGDIGSAGFSLTVWYDSTTTVRARRQRANVTDVDSDVISATTPTTIASGDYIHIRCSIPIVGWSASTQMSADADTRVLAVSAQLQAQSIANNSETTLGSWTVTQGDTHGAFNATSGIFTAPMAGWYVAAATLLFTAAANGSRYITFQKNGSGNLNICQNSTAISATVDTQLVLPGTPFYLITGETLRMRAFQNSGGALSIGAGANTTISIFRLTGPSAIAASESVNARYTSATAGSYANNTVVQVTYGTVDRDTHGAYASGTFTAPIAGQYKVTAALELAFQDTSNTNMAWATSESASLYLYKNGSLHSTIARKRFDVAITGIEVFLRGTDEVYLLAGQTIDIRLFQNSGQTAKLTASADLNTISIVRVGN